MKSFLLKLSLFSLLVLATTAGIFWKVKKNFSDRFYNKFKQPACSMVIGSSRALLGLDPETISKFYPAEKPFLNFSFTQATSPYGEVYYHAIESKLCDSTTHGIFILEIAPMGISESKGPWREKSLILGRMQFFNLDPNPEYIARNNEQPFYFNVFFDRKKKATQEPHPSGWLENLSVQDSLLHLKKMKEQDKEYSELFETCHLSSYRQEWLEKTIRLLSRHGRVVLLRMPVSPRMREMEDQYCPDFEKRMNALAIRTASDFIDLSGEQDFRYFDLHHMTSPSALQFSELLGRSLLK